MALSRNPTLSQANADVHAAEGMKKQSGLYPNPTVGYYGDEIRGGSYRSGKQGGFINQTMAASPSDFAESSASRTHVSLLPPWDAELVSKTATGFPDATRFSSWSGPAKID